MSLRPALAAVVAVAALGLTTPALAQNAPTAAPAVAADPAEAAFQAKAEAFGARIETMAGEMRAAALAAGGDQNRARVALDAIAARYQPEADAFSAELDALMALRMSGATDAQRAQMAQIGPMLTAQIKGAPAQARDQFLATVGVAAP